MLEEKAGQEEAVQAASAKLLAIEEFNEQLDGKVSRRNAWLLELHIDSVNSLVSSRICI